MTAYLITGGRLLLDTGLEDAAIRVEDGVITEIGQPPRDGAAVIDAAGLIVAPAIVDIHGDAFERQVAPRPNVYFPLDVAVLDTDRQLAAQGIATAYHALTLSWEPGLRSVERGAAFIDALAATGERLTVDHRLQLRWETFAFDAIPLIERAARAAQTPSIAFNDHTSMMLRAFDVPVTDRAFEQSPDFKTADLDDPRLRPRHAKNAQRTGLSEDDYFALLTSVWDQRPEVGAAISRVAAIGREAGCPMLSHDDTQEQTRKYYRALGADIAEFPMRRPVAAEARAMGEAVVLGAPNVVRGGSHIGSLSAADMIEDGLCTVLASDYAYPALPAAAGRLAAEKRADLWTIWSCISAAPAAALGLNDRGRLAPGLRADIVALDWPIAAGGAPANRLTLSGGRIAFLSGDLLA